MTPPRLALLLMRLLLPRQWHEVIAGDLEEEWNLSARPSRLRFWNLCDAFDLDLLDQPPPDEVASSMRLRASANWRQRHAISAAGPAIRMAFDLEEPRIHP